MSHIYEVKEWQGGSGYWYCNNVKDLSGKGSEWWVPARILDISPADFIRLLIDEYKVSDLEYDKDRNFLLFRWKNYANCHRYLLDINRTAKKKRFLV